jgi:hypothetical protein
MHHIIHQGSISLAPQLDNASGFLTILQSSDDAKHLISCDPAAVQGSTLRIAFIPEY